jgi:hypothetical protein
LSSRSKDWYEKPGISDGAITSRRVAKMPGFLLRQLVSVLILPFNVLLVIPGLLFLRCRGKQVASLAPTAALPITRSLGGLLVLTGLPLLLWTIREFGRSGQGTLKSLAFPMAQLLLAG